MQHGTSYMDMMVDVSGNFERQIIICSLSIVVSDVSVLDSVFQRGRLARC